VRDDHQENSMLTPAEVNRQWYESMWNGRREELIDQLMSADAVAHGLGAEPIRGSAGFKPFFRSFIAAVPDLHIEIVRMLVDGDMVATHIHSTGTHRGEGLGGPATNQRMAFDGMIISRVKNGQIVEGWNCIDFLTLYQQLGWVASPVQGPATS
jgi:steroid delta-isomerase-like uncharacterized protein